MRHLEGGLLDLHHLLLGRLNRPGCLKSELGLVLVFQVSGYSTQASLVQEVPFVSFRGFELMDSLGRVDLDLQMPEFGVEILQLQGESQGGKIRVRVSLGLRTTAQW